MATATNAKSAVITSAIMKPILDTQTSSSAAERAFKLSVLELAFRSIVRIALDCTCKSNYRCRCFKKRSVFRE